MIVSITGSREGLTDWQRERLTAALKRPSITGIVHGDCVGADNDADTIAMGLGLPRWAYPSNLYLYRAHTKLRGCDYLDEPRPPLERNRRIIEHGAACVALPRLSSRGTWHAIEIARSLGRPLWVLGEDRVLEVRR